MKPEDILAGPIVRRADPTMVAIWIATTQPYELASFVRPVGKGADWTGVSDSYAMHVCENLWVQLMIVAPLKGKFPTGELLEYSIAVVDADGNNDHKPFAAIVAADDLAYTGFSLPTFYLQGRGAKLNVLYASCRKPHDTHGGGVDALAHGDDLILNNTQELSTRPAVLCLGGDQIYADDVADETFDAMVALARKLAGSQDEKLPKGLSLPGKGQRMRFVQREAFFTSTAADNHVITFSEFAAMYGLVWNPRNWPGGAGSGDLVSFVATLRKVRRLLANTPTYMIFDDHDVTDDWNLSLQWFGQVQATAMGQRLVTNALFAFWLFQAWGNDPMREKPLLVEMQRANAKRLEGTALLEGLLSAKSKANGWEFHTPTYPAIYFLDTRTQRGHFDGFKRNQTKAPPFLKSVESWKLTIDRVHKMSAQQGASLPLVLVAAAPVFGFGTIDALQMSAGKFVGPYTFDEEGWAANRAHLLTFLLLCGKSDIVLLSGDVHYSFTSTARFDIFDSEFYRQMQASFPGFPFPKTGSGSAATWQHMYSSRFLQLNSSAAKNYASTLLEVVSRAGGNWGHVMQDKTNSVHEGDFKNGVIELRTSVPLKGTVVTTEALDQFKPMCAFHQKINNRSMHTPYLPDHNIGLMQITGRKVENAFLVGGKRVSSHTFDFATDTAWAS